MTNIKLLEPIQFTIEEVALLLELIEQEQAIIGDAEYDRKLVNLHMQLQSVVPGSDLRRIIAGEIKTK
jgi:hypothetical protein